MATVTFQQGVSGYTGTVDTMIQQATPTTAYGTSTKLGTDTGATADVQTLLTFNNLFGTNPGQIPLGATITSATLTLQTTNASADGASLHRMLTNWMGVPAWTWDSFNNGIQFDGTEAAAAADVSTGAVVVGSRDLNVTNSLQAWSNGATNYGWAFRAGGTDGWDFYSAQGTTKPKLTVTYELPTTGAPVVSIGNATAAEGSNAKITFTVSLDKAATQPVTVNYATADGTATAAADYTALNGSVTFAAGETSKTITIDLKDDTVTESTETFKVNLTSPTNATLGTAIGTGTITDNDAPPAAPPTVTITDATVTEGGQTTLTVTLSGPASGPVSVNYGTVQGTATEVADYNAAFGTLNFAAGEASKTITVQTVQDTLVESSENFSVALSAPSGATLGTKSSGVVTVTDNDTAPAPNFTISDASVTEGGGASFTVRLSANPTAPVSVNVATSTGTAAATDFTGKTQTLTFNPGGPLTQTFTVQTTQDTAVEPNETFNVALSGPTGGATLGAKSTGTGTITDDDSTSPPAINAKVVKVTDTTTYKAGDPSGYGSGDPSGLAYVPGSNTLFIADSEHEESPYFSTTNLFAVRPDGTHIGSYGLTGISKEPTGLAYNPKNGYLYITDDDALKVLWVDPANPSQKIGEFSVRGLGMSDPEDPKIDPVTGNIYMLDGFSRKFFELSPTGALLHSFVLPSVMTDAEALAYDATHDVFFVASGASANIWEMDRNGEILATINVLASGHANPISGRRPIPKGLELAPSSNPNDGNTKSLFVADMGNDQVNDGRLFEISLGTGWLIT